jgi:hypothetical protein
VGKETQECTQGGAYVTIALKIATTKSATSEKTRSHKTEIKAQKTTFRKSGGPDLPGQGLVVRPSKNTPQIASPKRRGNMNTRETFLLDNPPEVQEDTFTRKEIVIP